MWCAAARGWSPFAAASPCGRKGQKNKSECVFFQHHRCAACYSARGRRDGVWWAANDHHGPARWVCRSLFQANRNRRPAGGCRHGRSTSPPNSSTTTRNFPPFLQMLGRSRLLSSVCLCVHAAHSCFVQTNDFKHARDLILGTQGSTVNICFKKNGTGQLFTGQASTQSAWVWCRNCVQASEWRVVMTETSTRLRNEETRRRDDRIFCEGFFWECCQALFLPLPTIYIQIQYIRVFLVPGFFWLYADFCAVRATRRYGYFQDFVTGEERRCGCVLSTRRLPRAQAPSPPCAMGSTTMTDQRDDWKFLLFLWSNPPRFLSVVLVSVISPLHLFLVHSASASWHGGLYSHGRTLQTSRLAHCAAWRRKQETPGGHFTAHQ